MTTTYTAWITYGALAATLFFSGCGAPANPQRLREEILNADPEFGEVLDKHDELANRISLLEHELDLKRAQVEQKTAQLRKELEDVRKQVGEKTTKLKTLIKPEEQRIDHALAMANEERRANRQQRASVGRLMSQLRKKLKDTKVSWTEAERSQQDAQLNDLLQEAKRIDHEIAGLNEHIRLLKVKRIVLRL